MSLSRTNITSSGGDIHLIQANPELEEEKSVGFTSHPSRHCKIPSILSNISKRNLSIDSWFVDLPEISQIQKESMEIKMEEQAPEFCLLTKKRIFDGLEDRQGFAPVKKFEQAELGFANEPDNRLTPRHRIFDVNSPRREEYQSQKKLESSGKKFSEKTHLQKIEPHLPPMNEEISINEESRVRERSLSSFGLQENSYQNSLSFLQGIQKKMTTSNFETEPLGKRDQTGDCDTKNLVSFGSFLSQKKLRSGAGAQGKNDQQENLGEPQQAAQKGECNRAQGQAEIVPATKAENSKAKQTKKQSVRDEKSHEEPKETSYFSKLCSKGSEIFAESERHHEEGEKRYNKCEGLGVLETSSDRLGPIAKNLMSSFENLLRKKEVIERKSDEKIGMVLKRSDTSNNNALSTTGDEKQSCKSLEGYLGRQCNFADYRNTNKGVFPKNNCEQAAVEIRAFETYHQNKNFLSESIKPSAQAFENVQYFCSGNYDRKNDISINKVLEDFRGGSDFYQIAKKEEKSSQSKNVNRSEIDEVSKLSFREPLEPAKPEHEHQERNADHSCVNISCQNISFLSDVHQPDAQITEQAFVKTGENHISACSCCRLMENASGKNFIEKADFLLKLPELCREQSEKIIKSLLNKINKLSSESQAQKKGAKAFKLPLKNLKKKIKKRKGRAVKKSAEPSTQSCCPQAMKKDIVLKLAKHKPLEDDIFSYVSINEKVHFTSEESFSDSHTHRRKSESFTEGVIKGAPKNSNNEETSLQGSLCESYKRKIPDEKHEPKMNNSRGEAKDLRKSEISNRSGRSELSSSRVSQTSSNAEANQNKIHEKAKMSVSIIKPSTNPFLKTELKRSQTEFIGANPLPASESLIHAQSFVVEKAHGNRRGVSQNNEKFDFIKAKVQHPLFSKQSSGHILNKALIEQSCQRLYKRNILFSKRAMEEGFAKCDRNGCKRKFKIADNTQTSCNYHPGKPIFHDLKKGWTCCNQIVYDWDEFQALKPCMVGEHLAVSTESTSNSQNEFFKSSTVSNAQKGLEKFEANSVVIKSIDDFNKQEEEKKKLEAAAKPVKEMVPFVTPSGNHKCIHKGCLKEFKEAENTDSSCKFHPGEPIFHDLKKFWSCCRVETWDWDEFVKLPTCATGKHDAKMIEKV